MHDKAAKVGGKGGRPSKEVEDRPKLLLMLERWCGGAAKVSDREVSRLVVGLQPPSDAPHKPWVKPEAGPPTHRLESEADRLRRRFAKLKKHQVALPISVFLVHRQENIAARGVRSAEWVINQTATRCGVEPNEVERLAEEGWALVNDWMPNTYSPPQTHADES